MSNPTTKELEKPVATDSRAIDTYINRVKYLPPTPTLMIQLINLFHRHDADVDEITKLLQRDPALSAEVLRRCRNSFFGGDQPARDINEAVFCLGFYEVYQITVTLFGMRMLAVEKEAPGFPAEQLRWHSSVTGIAAGKLAQRLNAPEGTAFTAGLLHDVGKFVLAMAEGKKYVALLEASKRTGISLSLAEKARFGFDHSELGARLLQRWGLPEEVVASALGHNEEYGHGNLQSLVFIISLSSRLANHIASQNPTGRLVEMSGVKPLMEALGLQETEVQEWEQAVREKVKQLPGLMMAWTDSSGL
jgi:putative nucleotidyltransferase with HDIG domain